MEPAAIAVIVALVLILLIAAVLLTQRRRRQGTLKVTSGVPADAGGDPPSTDPSGAPEGSETP
jgi:hypothetical protein